MNKKQYFGDFLMLITTIFWGGGSVFSKQLLGELDEFTVLALRFIIGFFICLLGFRKKMKNIRKKTVWNSCLLGTILFLSFLAMMFGVRITSASNSGFIMSLSVIFVPVILFLVERKGISLKEIISIAITVFGVGILCLEKNASFNTGDFLTLICAIIYAVHIIVMEKKVKDDDPIQIGILQLLWAGILCLICSLIFETPGLPVTGMGWLELLYLGVLCTGCGFLFQSIAQTKTSATHISMIYAALPAFVAIYSLIFCGESISGRRIVGIIIMITGIALMELDIKKLKLLKDIDII